MKRNIALIIVGLVAVAGFIFVLTTSISKDQVKTSVSPSISSSLKYSAADVAKHASSSDCWTIIDGGVYNITSYTSQHPGGSQILQACGVDASQVFHGMSGVGREHTHSSDAQDILSGMQVGSISN